MIIKWTISDRFELEKEKIAVCILWNPNPKSQRFFACGCNNNINSRLFCCTFVYYTFIQNVSRNIKAFNSKSIMKSTTTTAFLTEQKNWANSAGKYRKVPIRIANKTRWKGPPGFIKLPLENGMRRRDPKTKTLFWRKR